MRISCPELLQQNTIADFLALWLSNDFLPAAEQKVFDYYYRSYKSHFGPYVRHWYSRQTKELIEAVRRLDNQRVLEVGCGCGTESLWAALQGAAVTGIDISSDLLGVADARLDLLRAASDQDLRCRFFLTSLLDLDERPQFDIIFLEQAFHHLEPRREVIGKLSQLLAPGGCLIFSEANGWNPLIQAAVFNLRGMNTITTYNGYPWGNERITVPWAMIRDFKPSGLRPISLQYYRLFPNRPIADRIGLFDRSTHTFLKPLFTHFNIAFKHI